MKYFLILVSIFFLAACGSGSSSGSDGKPPIEDNNLYSFSAEEDGKTQWAIYKDSDFYIANGISDDAHINPQDVYDKYSGKGIKVAIIDDGFDTTHPDFKGRILKTIDCTSGACIENVSVSQSDSSKHHGTAVAGIIGANADTKGIRGISMNAQLILIKMPELVNASLIIQMFQKAIDAGARVINCSWGTNNLDQAVEDYVDTVSKTANNNKGVTIVFASGNTNSKIENDEASMPGVIAVGATGHQNIITAYSCYGKELDVVAPGGTNYSGDPGISTLDPVGSAGKSEDSYNLYNETRYGNDVSFIGTSAAAPIVSGAIALMIESNPNITFTQIKKLLQDTSDKIGTIRPYMNDVEVTNSTTPTFEGILIAGGYSDFSLRIKDINGTEIGVYSISSSGTNWSSSVTDVLPEGNYTAEIFKDSSVYATDENFEVSTTKSELILNSRNDNYGYGKINLYKLVQGSISLK